MCLVLDSFNIYFPLLTASLRYNHIPYNSPISSIQFHVFWYIPRGLAFLLRQFTSDHVTPWLNTLHWLLVVLPMIYLAFSPALRQFSFQFLKTGPVPPCFRAFPQAVPSVLNVLCLVIPLRFWMHMDPLPFSSTLFPQELLSQLPKLSKPLLIWDSTFSSKHLSTWFL